VDYVDVGGMQRFLMKCRPKQSGVGDVNRNSEDTVYGEVSSNFKGHSRSSAMTTFARP